MREALGIMIGTFEGLLVFFLLLPGFFVERLSQLLWPYETKDLFQKLVNSGFYTLLLYIFYLFGVQSWGWAPLPIEIVEWRTETGVITQPQIHLWETFWILLAVLVLAIVIVPGLKLLLVEGLSRLGWTPHTQGVSPWDQLFSKINMKDPSGIMVKLKNGTEIEGWVDLYSTTPSSPQLLIKNEEGFPLKIDGKEWRNGKFLIKDKDDIEWIFYETPEVEKKAARGE